MSETQENHARQQITAHIMELNRSLGFDLGWTVRTELLAAKSQALMALAIVDSRKGV